MRTLLPALLLCATAATATAQTTTPPDALPDSTYLLLTLELPVHGTFTLTRTTSAMRSGRQTATTLARRIGSVEIRACVLNWRLVQHTLGQRGFGTITDVTVPLKEIDLKSIEARPAFQGADERLEPTPWQTVGYALKGKKSTVTQRNPDTGITSRTHMFSIMVSDEESARRFAAGLKDAATRCDSWRTAPMPVIR